MQILRHSTLHHHLPFTIWDIFTQPDNQVQFHLMMVHGLWKILRSYMVRWELHGITLLNQLTLMKSWEEFQVLQEEKLLEYNNLVLLLMKKSIMHIWLSILVLMFSMKQIKLTFADKLSQTQRVRRLRFYGHLPPMTKWPWWSMVTHQFGKCTKTHGIQFQVSCQSEYTLITIWVFLTHGSNMNRTVEFIIWWQKIKCLFQKMQDHTHQSKIQMQAATSGNHKRTSLKRMKCVILTGTPRTHTITSTTDQTSKDQKIAKLTENTHLDGEHL